MLPYDMGVRAAKLKIQNKASLFIESDRFIAQEFQEAFSLSIAILLCFD